MTTTPNPTPDALREAIAKAVRENSNRAGEINSAPDELVTDILSALAPLVEELKRDRERMLLAAQGCHDYGGGYRDAKESEIFHHGIQTVINVVEAASKRSDDTQVNALVQIARAARTTGERS